ncbi:hypothetical protein M4R22_16595 [Acidovorax sp. GBBC 3334]|uniref:hypothetical protein n=1 Tax=Acidovorax sp. GBBC 3334 TaxID=2940496 RepID=UPI0023043D38|nr:hypothetical protein [Acidovorax sp. GBBC 3334]MDA8456384.1 hypothetical protein [Acidovorax sp. GBBC 3334]
MTDLSLTCRREGCGTPVRVTDAGTINHLLFKLRQLYRQSTLAADGAAQHWADVATASESPFAPLAHVPGVFATLWTPDVAPTTATVLGSAGYGFAALPKHLTHFTTRSGAAGIARTGLIHASRAGASGIFGPGVYMARFGPPVNLMIREVATVPIVLPTPAGTVRILPYIAYVRWGAKGVRIQ